MEGEFVQEEREIVHARLLSIEGVEDAFHSGAQLFGRRGICVWSLLCFISALGSRVYK